MTQSLAEKKSVFATEPVGKLILKFAVPCVISLVVNALYNIVDQIFIRIFQPSIRTQQRGLRMGNSMQNNQRTCKERSVRNSRQMRRLYSQKYGRLP